jgi:hypothetical protein
MFMRYCGGGPGHLGVPVCDLAWRIQHPAPTVEEIQAPDHSPTSSDSEDDSSEYNPDDDERQEFTGQRLVLLQQEWQ